MKINQEKIFGILVSLFMVFGIGFGSIPQAMAQENETTATAMGVSVPVTPSTPTGLVPEAISDNAVKQAGNEQSQSELIILNAPKGINSAIKVSPATTPVTGAILTIFAVSSGTISSSIAGHGFITVKNVSTGGLTINVGKFSGIASGKTMSLGTWDSSVTTEHRGLWYDLEAYKLYKNGAFSGRVSVSYLLNASQINNLNNYIINHDSWSLTSPCSSFAVNAWNSVVDSSYQLSAGIPSTPTNLRNNIQSKFKSQYMTNGPIPYDYVVYYANGTGAPIRSNVFK